MEDRKKIININDLFLNNIKENIKIEKELQDRNKSDK